MPLTLDEIVGNIISVISTEVSQVLLFSIEVCIVFVTFYDSNQTHNEKTRIYLGLK